MTKEEALKLLRGGTLGVADWNSRRKAGEGIPNLKRADLRNVDLHSAILSDANLSSADLFNAKLFEANLSNATLFDANLSNAKLSGANLSNVKLSGANLSGTILSDANLYEAYLDNANLKGAILTRANLRGANMMKSSLVGTNLRGSDLCGAHFGLTIIACDLSEIIGLDEVIHHGPSIVWINSLLNLEELPETFLRGCGFRNEEIEYLRSVVGKPIRFYTCFISYSTADDVFASRLHNDFQAAGIRCWKWDHDARTGEDLFGEINQAIRVHDKVVLIASKDSLTSPPVNREIERAIQEEDRRSKLQAEGQWKGVVSVLFPVRVDDYIFESTEDGEPKWDHPRRADVTNKMIADAVGWDTDNKKYKTVLERLIHDLKAE